MLTMVLLDSHLELLRVTTLAIAASLWALEININYTVCSSTPSLFVASMFVLTLLVSQHTALTIAGAYSGLSDYEVDDFRQTTEEFYLMYFGTSVPEEVRADESAVREAFIRNWVVECS